MLRVYLLCLLCPLSLHGIGVAEGELKSVQAVEFQDYKGPYTSQDSVRAVRSIGKALAKGLKDADHQGFYGKYTVIRCIGDGQKFPADVLVLEAAAQVKSIAYLRLIIAGYLESAYGYGSKEAAALAVFITYYNATYRGNIEYVQKQYQNLVLGQVTQANVGLALGYREWAGKTRLLIPLVVGEGELGGGEKSAITVDPFPIASSEVRAGLQHKTERLPEHKELLNLKQKDLQARTESLKNAQTLSLQLKQELATQRKDFATTKNPDLQARIRDNEKKLKNLNEHIEHNTQDIKKRRADLSEHKAHVTAEELRMRLNQGPQVLPQIHEDLLNKAIELDRREDSLRDAQLDVKVFNRSLYYLKTKGFVKDGHYNNEMFILNADTGEVLVRAPIANICGRKYDVSSRGIIVISNVGSHDSTHYLSLLDKETLAPITTGKDAIFARSFLEIREDFIYATLIHNGDHFLGKFSLDLELLEKSDITIAPDTFLSIFEDFIYLNDKNDAIVLLNKDSLKQVKRVQLP